VSRSPEGNWSSLQRHWRHSQPRSCSTQGRWNQRGRTRRGRRSGTHQR